MEHLYKNRNIKTLKFSVFKESAGPGGVRLHKYHILDYTFQILDTEDFPVKQILPSLAILSQKRYCQHQNDIAKIIKKPQNFVTKTKNSLEKKQNDLGKLHPDFSEEGKEERQLGMWVFSAKI